MGHDARRRRGCAQDLPPFLAEWRARAADLARRATAPTALERFPLGIAQHSKATGSDAEVRAAYYALNAPDLLPTPSSLEIVPKSFAIWRTGPDTWCASTARESVVSHIGEPVRVRWLDVLPAKGGGSSSLEIGSWAVRDVASSPAVKAAAKAVSALAGVRLERVEGYDC